MDKLLEELHGKELPEQLLEFYFCVRDFLNIDELLDENYVVYTEMGEGGKVILRLFCVNPAANIHRCLSKLIITDTHETLTLAVNCISHYSNNRNSFLNSLIYLLFQSLLPTVLQDNPI